ncbi:MAG TPA: hypothetical protein VGM41_03515 [Chitinophagaceae bacterium]|jgi:hypothetical protein
MLFQSTINTIPFSKWWHKDRENRGLLAVSALLIVAQFVWFKVELPYPNFVQDTYGYLQSAANNDFVGKFPIGYSKYLQLTGLFSRSTLAPVLIQYLFLQAAILYFFLTLRWFFNPGKWLMRILIVFSVLNPLLLKVSNLLTADALFAGFSLIWFTQLLWLLYKPTTRRLVIHAFVLLFAFMLREAGLYYSVISIAVIVLAPMRVKAKLVHVVFIVLLFALWAGTTQYAYNKQTDSVQISAARGWQRANNVLYAYAHAPQDTGKNVEYRFRKLQALVNHQDSMKYRKHGPDESIGNYYIEDKASPLHAYMRADTTKAAVKGSTNRWLLMGPFYSKYADWLLKEHRGAYLRHFILPNTKNYFVPDPEYTGYYFPFGITDSVAIKWFHLSNNRLYTYQADKRISIVNYMPGLMAMSNVVFLLGFIAFGLLGGLARADSFAKRVLLLALVTMVFHAVVSITLAPVVLRQLVFPFMIAYTFGTFFVVSLVQESSTSAVARPVPEHDILQQAG